MVLLHSRNRSYKYVNCDDEESDVPRATSSSDESQPIISKENKRGLQSLCCSNLVPIIFTKSWGILKVNFERFILLKKIGFHVIVLLLKILCMVRIACRFL